MNPHKILMPTDVPFWRQSTGAQKRIFALVRFLNRNGFHVQTFCLRPMEEGDEWTIGDQNLDVISATSLTPPQAVAKKIKWYADATMNQLKKWISNPEEISPAVSLKLDDFKWPWAMQKFSEQVRRFQPNSILVQYVKFAYLLDALTVQERSTIGCVLDTHDLLHLRAQQFAQRGLPHWLNIDRVEESVAFQTFDLLIAIQAEEAVIIQEMAPETKTIVAGHSLAVDLEAAVDSKPQASELIETPETEADQSELLASKRVLRVGFLGSMNLANESGVNEFLEKAWAKLPTEKFELIIGGGICETYSEAERSQWGRNVQLFGYVENVKSFYNEVDVIVNPVQFGSGLKIKNCEAYAFSKPVVTTQHGFEALPQQCKIATIVVDEIASMAEAIASFQQEPTRLIQMQEEAGQLARSLFSDSQAYSELAQALLSRH